MPYPTPADRKDLENLVKNNWESKISRPYHDWDMPQLQTYLKAKGADTKSTAASNKNSLIKQVQDYWTETSDSASNAYNSVKDWIFDGSSSTPIPMITLTDMPNAAGPTPNSKRSPIKMVFPYHNLASVIP